MIGAGFGSTKGLRRISAAQRVTSKSTSTYAGEVRLSDVRLCLLTNNRDGGERKDTGCFFSPLFYVVHIVQWSQVPHKRLITHLTSAGNCLGIRKRCAPLRFNC
jgi:hypothetical protein